MKRTTKAGARQSDELRKEYRIDYSKAKHNRFAGASELHLPPAARVPSIKVAKIMQELKASLSKAKAPVQEGSIAVLLDPDVARVFRTAQSVNGVLRALLATMPPPAPAPEPSRQKLRLSP